MSIAIRFFHLFFAVIFVTIIMAGVVSGADSLPEEKVPKLMTAWGNKVLPEQVHFDYPRPTLVRRDWLSLNGYWEWKQADAAAMSTGDKVTPFSVTKEGQLGGNVLVPFSLESSLSGVGKHFDRVVYRRLFKIPQAWQNDQRILLHFGAVDWEAVVYVNGQLAGKHQGAYDPFYFDITNHLKTSREDTNELIVYVFDPTNRGEQPCGKQSTNPSGTQYQSVTGIWQTVWLEPVSKSYIQSLDISTSIDQSILAIHPLVENPRPELSLRFEMFDGEELLVEAFGGFDGRTMMKIPKGKLKLWSPDSPFLYQIRVQLLERGVPIDQVNSYAAFRKIDLAKNSQGRMRIRLNDKFVFLMGIIDQGYWPDGLYTPPCDDAVKSDIMTAKSMGFNLIRKHLKVESERWYYWCDRVGIMVWQDMPSGANRTNESQKIFRHELQRMINSRSRHPSIIIWSLFNEGLGQHKTAEYVKFVRQLDNSRLINAASGWRDFDIGDLKDNHEFPGPEPPIMDNIRCGVIGSFGGITLLTSPEHLWATKTWGYSHVKDSGALLSKYNKMHTELKTMIENGLSAAVFHQFTDVESEINGIITYDRALIKIPINELKKINQETIKYGSEE
jgi:beta-galactosidase/beta-glucuronidase